MDDGSGLPSALAATSLDAHVLTTVTSQSVATWFSIVGSDIVSKFHRGVMPVDPHAYFGAGDSSTSITSFSCGLWCREPSASITTFSITSSST